MGCCVGLRNSILIDKEIIEDLDPNEKRAFIVSSCKDNTNEEESKIKTKGVKQEKSSSKTVETNNEENLNNNNNNKKSFNPSNKRIKDASKNLKLITVSEVKNIHKFFV